MCLRLLFRYLAGDDPLTPRRCEPVPAVAWSLDREQPRRRSSQAWPAMIAHAQQMRTGSGRHVVDRSEAAEAPQLAGMAGDDRSRPADANRFRPSRGRSIGSSRDAAARRAWPAMIRTTFPRVSKMGLSGLFFDVLPPFLSPFSYNSLIYLYKLYFFTNYSRVFGPILCDLLPAPPFALLLVAVAVLFSRSPLLSMSRSFSLLSSKFGPFSRCFGAVLWHPCRMIPNFGGRIRKNSVKTGVFGAKIRKNAAKPPEKLGKIRFVSPRWHVLTI